MGDGWEVDNLLDYESRDCKTDLPASLVCQMRLKTKVLSPYDLGGGG